MLSQMGLHTNARLSCTSVLYDTYDLDYYYLRIFQRKDGRKGESGRALTRRPLTSPGSWEKRQEIDGYTDFLLRGRYQRRCIVYEQSVPSIPGAQRNLVGVLDQDYSSRNLYEGLAVLAPTFT